MKGKRRPGILLITVDEMRKDSLGCYGNRVIQTPNLDALAGESLMFDRAYAVSPWCLPSRCAILTGRYPHRNGAYSNFRKHELSPSVPNFFNTLKKSDYRTAMIGKCHFAPVPYDRARPDTTLPFEERDYYRSLGIDHLYVQDGNQVSVWYSDDYSRELQAAGYLEAYRKEIWNKDHMRLFPFPGPAEWHPDSRVGAKAVEYIQDCDAEEDQCIWVSFSGPHFPFDPPQEYYSRVDMLALAEERLNIREGEFDEEERIFHWAYHGGGPGLEGSLAAPGGACKNYTEQYWTQLRRNYYANVAQIDDYVGDILAAARRKFGQDLLVIFTADHGDMLGHHRLWGKNTCAYEDVLNVPMLVRYPNQNQHEAVGARVTSLDILPTILAVTGADEVPSDGVEFRKHIGAGGQALTFAEGEDFITVSDGRCKLVQVKKGGKQFCELFDLERDPQEFVNLAAEPDYQHQLAELRHAVINHFMQTVLP